MADKDEQPVPLPSAPLIPLAPNASLQPPLSRRGHGPGLVIISPGTDVLRTEEEVVTSSSDSLDPLPQKKWAEEGYAVVRLVFTVAKDAASGETAWDIGTALTRATDALARLETCDVKDKFALIVYGATSDYQPDFAPRLKSAYESASNIIACVSFAADWSLTSKPQLIHLAGRAPPSPSPSPPPSTPADTRVHHYAAAASTPSFVLPSSRSFSYAAAGVAHTRSLTFVKGRLGGPVFDLEAIWDEHTRYEFAERSVARTMGTMVDEPYVNHVPTITGGVGRGRLTEFYRRHFIYSNPDDAAIELVSRTVGVDRVVDEFVFCMTHDRVIDYLLPGVPPTNKPLRIPCTSVVNIRGDRLYHEHISWDQASVLVQLGLLPEYLPFPYPLPDGQTPAPGKRVEYRVPAAGAEASAKLQDQGAVESNGMFGFRIREVDS